MWYISNMQIVWYTVYVLIKISSFQTMCKTSIWSLEFTSYLSWLYHTMLVFVRRCWCYVWLYLCSPCFPNSFPRLVVRFGVLPCYSFSYSFVTLLICGVSLYLFCSTILTWWWFPVTFIALGWNPLNTHQTLSNLSKLVIFRSYHNPLKQFLFVPSSLAAEKPEASSFQQRVRRRGLPDSAVARRFNRDQSASNSQRMYPVGGKFEPIQHII